VEHVSAELWRISVDPHGITREFVLHVPVDMKSVNSIYIDGHITWLDEEIPLRKVSQETTVEIKLQ